MGPQVAKHRYIVTQYIFRSENRFVVGWREQNMPKTPKIVEKRKKLGFLGHFGGEAPFFGPETFVSEIA